MPAADAERSTAIYWRTASADSSAPSRIEITTGSRQSMVPPRLHKADDPGRLEVDCLVEQALRTVERHGGGEFTTNLAISPVARQPNGDRDPFIEGRRQIAATPPSEMYHRAVAILRRIADRMQTCPEDTP
jgi:hypothetical protein